MSHSKVSSIYISLHDPTKRLSGYYLYHGSKVAGLQSLYAQLWKEYTLSDSRYLTSDVFTVCVETITVVRGIIEIEASEAQD